MKLISLMFLLIFFTTSYAQAEESMPQTASQPQAESSSQNEPMQGKAEQKKTGFFSISIGGEAIPLDNFIFDAIVSSITFGGTLSKQSSFEAGVKLVDNGGLLFRYGYSFMEGQKWIPGVDITLLASASYNDYKQDAWKVSGGFELGPYLKTFISHSHSLFVRTGVAHYATIGEKFDIEEFRMYLNLGIQWHF